MIRLSAAEWLVLLVPLAWAAYYRRSLGLLRPLRLAIALLFIFFMTGPEIRTRCLSRAPNRMLRSEFVAAARFVTSVLLTHSTTGLSSGSGAV